MSNKKTIEERISGIIKDNTGISLSLPDDKYSPLLEMGKYDSLSHVEVIMGIEDEFEIEIGDEEFEHLGTLNLMAQRVKSIIDA